MPERKELKFRKLIGLEAACLLSVPLFFALVWIPVYQTVAGDVLMQESIFLLLWDFLKEGLTHLFYWFSIAFLAVSLLSFGWKGSFPFFGLYLLASVLRLIGTALSSAIVLQSFDDVFKANLADASLEIAFDLLLMAVFSLIFFFAAMRGRKEEDRKTLLPPEKTGFRPMRLHLAVLLSIAAFYAVRLFGRIRYDVFYGAATGAQDMAWIVFYYAADLALAVFGYFAVILLLKKLTAKK